MPADEVHHADSAGEARARTGPRHAAPRKPLLTRLHVPAGKAIAIASMPTAILMGMGFTPTLAQADDKPSAKNLTIDEYKDCVEALDDSEKDAGKDDEGKDEDKAAEASATPSPSASASAPAGDDDDQDPSGGDSAGGGSTGGGSSSDSGSEDKPAPAPSASTSTPAGSGGASTPTPTPSQGGGNILEGIGDALEDILTPGGRETATPTAQPSATPSPSATKSASEAAGKPKDDPADDGTGDAGDPAKDATEPAADATEKAEDAADEATASPTPTPTPSPSASSTTDPDDCPAATDEEGGVETGIPALADDPWMLEASSLTLKGADYKGIVKVKTANGSVKEVLKYVISGGTDIGDLHQIVDDKDAGVRYHVQGGSGTTSTIKNGKTVMYTESISGNLLGLIPITFDPEHPPPLNIPLIYFTKVKVVQAAQFGGDLTIPGMRQYNTPLG